MSKLHIKVQCWNCPQVIEMGIEAPRWSSASTATTPRLVICTSCGQSNRVYLPEDVDIYGVTLGEDDVIEIAGVPATEERAE